METRRTEADSSPSSPNTVFLVEMLMVFLVGMLMVCLVGMLMVFLVEMLMVSLVGMLMVCLVGILMVTTLPGRSTACPLTTRSWFAGVGGGDTLVRVAKLDSS